MIDNDFLKLCWIASVVYGGNVWAACEASQKFATTGHVNVTNLKRILANGFEPNERTVAWLVGSRKLPVSQYVKEVAFTGFAHSDIRQGWTGPVLIRRIYL
jgi:hypothetical protein